MVSPVDLMRAKNRKFLLMPRRRFGGAGPSLERDTLYFGEFVPTTGGHYEAAASGPPQSPAAWAVIFNVPSDVVSSSSPLFFSNASANAGWGFWNFGGQANFVGFVQTSTGRKYSPAFDNYGTRQDGVWHACLCVYDGANLRMYANGRDLGANAAGGTYVPPLAADRLCIGSFDGSASNRINYRVGGVMINDTVPTADEVADWFTQVARYRRVMPLASGTNYVYDPIGIQDLPTLWEGTQGTESDLTKSGSPAVGSDTSPLFAFGTGDQVDWGEATENRAGETWFFDERTAALGYYNPQANEVNEASDGAVYAAFGRTNYCLYSTDLTGAAWSLVGSASRTADVEAAPSGNLEADRLTVTAAAGDGIEQDVTALASGTYQLSCWVKAPSGTKDGRLILIDDTGTHVQTFTANGTWQRVIVEGSRSGVGTSTVQVLNDVSGTASGSILLWGFQLERGGFWSQHIPTEATQVTRTSDDLIYPAIPEPARAYKTHITVWCDHASTEIPSGNKRTIFYLNSSNYLLIENTGTVTRMDLRNGGTNTYVTLEFGRAQGIEFTLDWDAMEVTIAGADTGDGTYTIGGLTPQWPDNGIDLRVGRDSSGSWFYGFISRLEHVA